MTRNPPSPTVLDGVPVRVHGNGSTAMTVYEFNAGPRDPFGWVDAHRAELSDQLRARGLLLLRGLPVDVDVFHDVVAAVGGETLRYTERSTPRSDVGRNIYTSTDYPADQAIPMHNENSYSDRWPTAVFFFCETAPASGGATPIADSRAVLQSVPDAVRARFAGGVAYTRTFRDGLGLSWREAFQTADRGEVESYCAEHSMDFDWVEDDGLRTRHVQPATRVHPGSGEEVWFNQANLFHVSSLEPDVREALTSPYDEENLPRNAYLSNGEPIRAEDVAAIARAYADASVAVPWRPGDVLAVDNMLMAHGRQPFTGARRILVAMT
jgi:alpha-ketoglutarate-dependent taurine dioxygenase